MLSCSSSAYNYQICLFIIQSYLYKLLSVLVLQENLSHRNSLQSGLWISFLSHFMITQDTTRFSKTKGMHLTILWGLNKYADWPKGGTTVSGRTASFMDIVFLIFPEHACYELNMVICKWRPFSQF